MFHDFPETEYFDIDKSARFISPNTLLEFQQKLEEGAIKHIMSKIPRQVGDSLSPLLKDHESEEYHISRVVDLIDLLHQTNVYWKKKWLDKDQYDKFNSHALQQLKQYEKQFHFLKQYLMEIIA